jgi:hypothetical protein
LIKLAALARESRHPHCPFLSCGVVDGAVLVNVRRNSHFIFDSANYEAMDEVISCLVKNCRQGKALLPEMAAVDSSEKRRQPAGKAI